MNELMAPYSTSPTPESAMAVTANLLSQLITLNQRQTILFNELVQHMQAIHLLLAANNVSEHKPAPMNAPFYATLFGSFALYRGQTRLVLGHNKSTLELCRYLVAHTGKPIAREVLMDLLWPDCPIQQSTHRLHVAISTLRHVLGGGDVGKTIIVYEDDHYVLPSHLVVTDCDLFETAYKHARSWLQQRDFTNTANAYRRAIALCQGDYLVEQLYAEWTHTPRTYFAECRLNALTFLCEHAAMENDFAGMVDYAAQLLAQDNLRERAHRYLMRAYYSLGQRATAVSQYRRCLDLLARELGVSPSQQTQQLFQAICQDTPLPDEIPLFNQRSE